MDTQKPIKEWDVFISYAFEDKNDFAQPLANCLRDRGLRVWFDEFALSVGDRLHQSINYGLARSRYGVVIISPNFLKKEWPLKELTALLSMEDSYNKIILPIWHNLDFEYLKRNYPILCDRLAVKSNIGVNYVADEIIKAMYSGEVINWEEIRLAIKFVYTAQKSNLRKYDFYDTFYFTISLKKDRKILPYIEDVEYFRPNESWSKNFGEDVNIDKYFQINFIGWGAPTVPAKVYFSNNTQRMYYIRHDWPHAERGGLIWKDKSKKLIAIGIFDESRRNNKT
jgi:hypothetical protein